MEQIIEELVKYSKQIYERNLVSGMGGNISARFQNNDFDVIAISPTGSILNEIENKDVVLVDLNGNYLTKGKASSEILLHTNIYKKRDDINGIVHTHSPYATGFAFSNRRLKRLEGFGEIKKPYIEEVPYEKPGTKILADKTAEKIENEDCLLLKNHGVITTGANLKEAVYLAEFIEETAKIQFVINCLKEEWKK